MNEVRYQMKRLSKEIRRNAGLMFISPLLAISLIACTTAPTSNDGEELVRGDDIAGTSQTGTHQTVVRQAVSTQSSDDLIFNLLAGEFAGVRGQMESAIEYYSAAADISDDPEVIKRAAYIALYAGNDQKALELTDRWLKLDLGDNKTIHRLRALAFLHLQNLEQSVEAVEKLLMTNGKVNAQVISSLTHILGKETDADFALKVVARLAKKYPQDVFLTLLQAKFEASHGLYESALKHVEKVIGINADLVDVYLVKAQILLGQGYQQAAVEAIAIAVEKRPEDTGLRLQYGRMLVQMKAFDKALAHFLDLRKVMPENENVLLSLGLLSIETGDHNQAKQYLQELLDKGYHNQQAHYYLGRIQQSHGEDMAAIANYERVLGGDYWLDSRLRSVSLIAKSGQIETALNKLDTLSKRDHSESNLIKVYLAKGEVLRGVSRNKEAYSLYNNALNQSPENTDLLYARALTAEKLDMLDVTESDLKMVIMHEPENASALNALGYTLADRTERLNEARDYILKASQLLPDDPAILDSLGWVYYRLGQYQDAIKWLSKAFDTMQDAEIAAHLGAALWMSGKTEEAKNIWVKGEDLGGNQTVLRDTIQSFQQ